MVLHDRSCNRGKGDPDARNSATSFIGAFLYADTLRAKQKGECVKLQVVQWAGCAGTGTFHDVEVDHGCGDIGMAEEALDGPDVRSGFQQMGGKAVAEGMRGDSLGDSRFAHALAQLAGHGVVMEMVSGDFSGAWVRAEGGGRKEVLPAPLPASVRPFALERFRHMDIARTYGEILEMFFMQ